MSTPEMVRILPQRDLGFCQIFIELQNPEDQFLFAE